MTLITLSVPIPVKANDIPSPHTTRTIYAASPHTYEEKWNEWGVGELYMWNDADYLYVAYVMKWGDYKLVETHVAVDKYEGELVISETSIPQTKKGNPKVGKFPYKMDHNPTVTEYTYRIPLDAHWGVGDTLVIAAHAVVLIDGCLEETAWANCEGPTNFFFPGANWATTVRHTITEPAT